MLEHIRARWTRAIRPIVRALLRLGIRPDAVTWFGTVVLLYFFAVIQAVKLPVLEAV